MDVSQGRVHNTRDAGRGARGPDPRPAAGEAQERYLGFLDCVAATGWGAKASRRTDVESEFI